MAKMNLGRFNHMESMGSITNSSQLEVLKGRIQDKVVCDLGAGVGNLLGSSILRGNTFSSGYEVDPVFSSEQVFEQAKKKALKKVDELLSNFSKALLDGNLNVMQGEAALEKFSSEKGKPEYQEIVALIEAAKEKFAKAERTVASLKEQQNDITGNMYENSNGIIRKTSLSSEIGLVDTFILTSVFYGSRSPAIVLFALNKLLGESGEIVIFDHESKPHIPRLLKLDGKDGIEVLSKQDDECAIKIPKSGVKLARSRFR